MPPKDEDEQDINEIIKGLVENQDYKGLMSFLKGQEEKTIGNHLDEGEKAGIVDPRAADKRRRNASRIEAMDAEYEYKNGVRVRKQEDFATTMQRNKDAGAESVSRREAIQQGLQEDREAARQGRMEDYQKGRARTARLDPSFVGPSISTEEESIRDTRSKAASNEAARVQGEREARPFAAVVEGLTNPRGEDGKRTQESFEQISKGQNSEEFRESGSIEQGATRDGKSFKMVTRKTPYGDITTKVFDSAEDADSVTGMVPSSDGKTAQPISEVTSALAQQNAADAAPSIAETYANASRQQNRGVGGDRNPSTDIIAGLTATADPNIIANPAVNEKSKEDLEREKRIKAMTQGLFPSNIRRATAV
jgi:hypothetical protein